MNLRIVVSAMLRRLLLTFFFQAGLPNFRISRAKESLILGFFLNFRAGESLRLSLVEKLLLSCSPQLTQKTIYRCRFHPLVLLKHLLDQSDS